MPTWSSVSMDLVPSWGSDVSSGVSRLPGGIANDWAFPLEARVRCRVFLMSLSRVTYLKLDRRRTWRTAKTFADSGIAEMVLSKVAKRSTHRHVDDPLCC